MNCPVCDRSLAPTLSICPACGAMMNDTVREELQSKITPGSPTRAEARLPSMRFDKPLPPRPLMTPQPMAKRQETAGLVASKTSPTLVEFQNKNASLPDWRLQLQNAVQQRKGGQASIDPGVERSFPSNGGAALKAEIVPPTVPETAARISDPRVASAMRRIDESRQIFSEPSAMPKKAAAAKPAQMRSFPFDVVSPTDRAAAAAPARSAPPAPKPKLVVPPPPAEKRDTNKLPAIDQVIERVVPIDETMVEKVETVSLPPEFAEIKRIRIKAENADVRNPDPTEVETQEIEDLAPFSMRFGAGLFDLIIGGFAAMLILAPFAFSGASWVTPSGGLIVVATWAIVSFVYMTACLGFFGKTMGMRLFSLELVDAVENEYPTLQQAAINSSIFLIALPFIGAGFTTAYFNEERRAVHDLLSGTILVREF